MKITKQTHKLNNNNVIRILLFSQDIFFYSANLSKANTSIDR